MRVAVLGASPKRERYSNRAVLALVAKGHEVLPVTPGHTTIEGLRAYSSLRDIPTEKVPIDTVTVYVGPAHIGALIADVVAVRPRRVIMNPGAESPELTAALAAIKTEVVEACTLVMLSTGQF